MNPFKQIRVFSLFLVVVSSLAAKAPNILLICIDDLRPELGCYGVETIQSPHMDRLASQGILFARHFVQAPSCGPSRYTLLTGTYGPARNDALFTRAEAIARDPASVSPSMPAWFREQGYKTISVGKVSHHPGGLGGPDWNDRSKLEMPDSWDRSLMPSGPWQHPRGAMHGLANGEIRIQAGDMDLYQTFDGPDSAYPDGLITEQALQELRELADREAPFFLAVGLIRPHLPFGAPAQYMEPYADAELPPIPHPGKPEGRTTWHRSNEFMKYNRWGRDPNTDADFALEVRRHYAACVTYADAQVGRLLKELKEVGLDDDTIVVLWGDHGWHLGEHAIWGKHALFEESLHAPLIIRSPGRIKSGLRTDAVVESADIFPTLCELAGVPLPGSLQGQSLLPQIKDPDTPGRGAVSYINNAISFRSDTHRLIVHEDGYVELYSHLSPERETVNIAETHPKLVYEMALQLHDRVPGKFPAELLEKMKSYTKTHHRP